MMMMKGVMIHQQPNHTAVDNNQENMSNVTSAASGEAASVSSSNGGIYPPHYFANTAINQPPPHPIKKKRNQPGNPDPEAEVIALSPKTLMATNRFVCEICNKGFQRDQNLQLHRRGHNLPWKLKQRSNKDVVRKKVYVCPESSCVHHDPSRALGDLTGIKKHFCRKHGEKKWKCEKCSKRYAVQSDWKAHSKTCGTREYRCDCGTLFSRRDSFITHRAFCDVLAEESARAINGDALHHLNSQPRSSSAQPNNNISLHFQPPAPPQFGASHDLSAAASYSIKKEQPHSGITGFNLRPEIPPWLLPCPTGPPPPAPPMDLTNSIFQEFQNPNPSGPTLPGFHSTLGSPHISATALLQKAAQMGATMSGCSSGKTGSGVGPALVIPGAHTAHVSADEPVNNNNNNAADFGLNLSSRDAGFVSSGLASFGSKATVSAGAPSPSGAPAGSLLHDMMNSFSSSNPTFEDPLFGGIGGFLNNKKDGGGAGAGGGGGNDDITKDFLGLRPLSRNDIFNITGLVNSSSSSDHHQGQSQRTWQQT